MNEDDFIYKAEKKIWDSLTGDVMMSYWDIGRKICFKHESMEPWSEMACMIASEVLNERGDDEINRK